MALKQWVKTSMPLLWHGSANPVKPASPGPAAPGEAVEDQPRTRSGRMRRRDCASSARLASASRAQGLKAPPPPPPPELLGAPELLDELLELLPEPLELLELLDELEPLELLLDELLEPPLLELLELLVSAARAASACTRP
jgi:hypothetical protein